MRYVYLLQSEAFAGQRYVGVTSDLRKRIAEHNAEKSQHTSKYASWKLVTYVVETGDLRRILGRAKAEIFERYLKSGSGHAFASKRLW